MYWAMIFVMACGGSVTDDYTHNPSITDDYTHNHTISITRYYYKRLYTQCITRRAMIFVWWFSNRRLYTQSQHYTVLCTELWYLSWRVVVQLQTIIHTISALHGIMYWAMIFVMACGGSVTDGGSLYTQSQHYTGIMCWAMIFVMACGSSVTNDYTHNLSITRYYVLSYDMSHGVWWFSNRRLYTQSQHYTILCTELYLSWRVVVQ